MADENMPQERRDFYVYALLREDGSPFYVGKGKGRRCRAHLSPSVMSRTAKAHIIRRMVAAGHTVGILKLANGLTEAEAFALERQTIAHIGRHPTGPLHNLTDGGEGASGSRATESRRSLARASTAQAWARDPERKIAAALRLSDPKRQEAARKYWADPVNRAAAAERARVAAAAIDPAVRSARHARSWSAEARRGAAERAAAQAAARKSDPAKRAALTAAHATYWADPARRAAAADRARSQAAKRKNQKGTQSGGCAQDFVAGDAACSTTRNAPDAEVFTPARSQAVSVGRTV